MIFGDFAVLQMSIPDENGQAAVIDKSEGLLPKLAEGQLLGPRYVAIILDQLLGSTTVQDQLKSS